MEQPQGAQPHPSGRPYQGHRRPLIVEVHLFATLARYLPPDAKHGRARVDVGAGTTVGDLLRTLGIPDEMPRIVLVNGHDAEDARPLTTGDVVTAFPPLAGGRHAGREDAPAGDGKLGRLIDIRRGSV